MLRHNQISDDFVLQKFDAKPFEEKINDFWLNFIHAYREYVNTHLEEWYKGFPSYFPYIKKLEWVAVLKNLHIEFYIFESEFDGITTEIHQYETYGDLKESRKPQNKKETHLSKLFEQHKTYSRNEISYGFKEQTTMEPSNNPADLAEMGKLKGQSTVINHGKELKKEKEERFSLFDLEKYVLRVDDTHFEYEIGEAIAAYRQRLNEIYVDATQSSWKPTTARNHEYTMEKYILNKIGRHKIKNVTTLILQKEIFDPLVKQGFTEGALIATYRRISAVFNFAVKHEILSRKRISTPNLKNAAQGVKREAIPIKGIDQILKIIRTKYKISHYTCICMLVLTGMRIGELRALQWKEVDFVNNMLYITETKDRFGARDPKTKNSVRKFPINKNIRKVLLDYKIWYDDKMERFGCRNPEGYVIVNYAGTPVGERFLKRIIDLVAKGKK